MTFDFRRVPSAMIRRMPTLTIELDELTYKRFEAKARERNVALDELAAEVVRASAGPESGVSPEMLAIMDDVIATYRPVFDRLAQ